MSNQNRHSKSRRLAITAAASALLGAGVLISVVQAADGVVQPTSPVNPLILAETAGMENRGERRDDRQGDRGDRQDNRQEARDEGGLVGKDKRDAKQEGRQEPAEAEQKEE